ncbi:LppA family lipoprotein [Marihabitans asiaticum]|nr:LppA family lipoprotein [Marihabitans asiaticum]
MEPKQELESRPRAAELHERYLAAMNDLQTQLSSQVPGVSFDQDPAPETEAGCQAPFDGLGGVSRSYLGGASTDDFDHSRWPQVEQVAEAVMRQHGFTADKVVIADDADYHKVSWFDEYGSDFSVSAEVRVASSIVGACALP